MELGWAGRRQVSDAGDGEVQEKEQKKEELVDIFRWRGKALFLKGKKFFFFLIFFSIVSSK